MSKQTKTIALPTTDFAVQIITDEIGATFQLVYDGKPAAGMSEFGGTFKRSRESMAEFLRKLAAEIEAVETECPHNWLGGYCDLCGATKE